MTSHWYLASNIPPDRFDQAQTAFEEGLQTFKTKLTNDPIKRAKTLKASKLQDLLDEVSGALAHYEDRRTGSKTRECITEFSKRVHYYGKVMDVVVQHHPEFASLAWGAMKIVFGSIVEHEKLGVVIVSAMSDIADALARIELAETLYPTALMKQAIASLYAYIIKFLIRAMGWYESSSISRAWQSVTRPADLRYNDLVQDIQKATTRVSELSLAASQAEQRDMNTKLQKVYDRQSGQTIQMQSELQDMRRRLDQLTTLVQQGNQTLVTNERSSSIYFQELVLMKQDIMASQVDIRHELSELQLGQALTFISSACLIDHKSSFQNSVNVRRVRKFSTQTRCVPFWTSPILHSWDASPLSSLLTLKATYHDRNNIRDFCTNLIEQILDSPTAVLWVLKPRERASDNVHEVLKSLIYQLLSLHQASHTDTVFSFRLRKFQSANSIEDYMIILGEMLETFESAYFIVDSDAVDSDSIEECRLILRRLPKILDERGAKTVLKVMFVEYRPGGLCEVPHDEKMLRVGRTSQRKGKKVPTEPLMGKGKKRLSSQPSRLRSAAS